MLGSASNLLVRTRQTCRLSCPDFYARLCGVQKPGQVLCARYLGRRAQTRRLRNHLLKPSLRELADLTARQIRTERDQEEAAQDLVEHGRCEFVRSFSSRWALEALCWRLWKDARALRQFRSRLAARSVPETACWLPSYSVFAANALRDAIRFGRAVGGGAAAPA